MKTILKAAFALLLVAGAGQTAQSGNKIPAPKGGSIRGRVIDHVQQQTLPGASVYIENLQTGVTSDINGFYALPNLNPGTYTVKVTYIGYEPVEAELTVRDG